ncbi:Alpha kinase [Phytophthora megakarya]|uniref:Alpha kinase n=1 Tax=Phytophthora megakarya TaxID=4795 RepID=A0A225WWL5_9STRA|nr:Alpha kinase [Phytophthora megakarya]
MDAHYSNQEAPLAVAVAYPAPVPAKTASTSQSPFEKLNTLKLLLDCGHLTADEYQERKTQIINDMTGTSTERKKPSPRGRRAGANTNPPPPPLQPLLKTVVPHGPPDFSRIRRERADKLSFDVDTLEWHSTPVRVKLDLVPFATGQLRNAYYLQELSVDGSPSRLLVAKVSLRPAEPSTYLSDVEMQAVCAHYAALYNEHEPPLKVCYARSWLLKLRDRERGALVCSVEEFLPGAYVKYSNNSGYVGRETSTTEERERNTPQAFSHFSFVASDFRLMIVDIQGVADSYTDPQIHSADGRGFGVGNLGTFGMEKFLESHRCNEVCRWLGLRSINEQYKVGGTAAPGYEMPFGGAIKKSTNRITEERNTFSTSVTVSEAFGDTATADWTEREDSRLESGDEEDEDEDEEDEEDPGEHSDSTSYATDSSPAMSGLQPRYPKSKRPKRFSPSSRGRGGVKPLNRPNDREIGRRFRHPAHLSKGGGLITGSPGTGGGGLWTCVVRNLFCGCA